MADIAVVSPSERERAVATIVSAFEHDPVERWLYPGASAYRRWFPEFVTAFGGDAFSDGTVWRLGDFDAVAWWFRPGREPDGDAVVETLVRTVAEEIHADAFATLEQMAAGHPGAPHWYLPWFAVRRPLQGAGLGSALMAECLAAIDDGRQAAYLETPNPRTVPFYERAGFAVTGVAQAGGCPPITLMVREAR